MYTLDGFNAAGHDAVIAELLACNASRRWAERLAAGRPFATVAAAQLRSDEVLAALDWVDLAEALAAHPRIGERVTGQGKEAAWSRQEQAGAVAAAPEIAAALVDGNRAYEQQFGHVFLICAAELTAEEMLAALRHRLGQDAATEREVVRDELAKITRLRLEKLLTDQRGGSAAAGLILQRAGLSPRTNGSSRNPDAPTRHRSGRAGIVLGVNSYGKAETRVVCVTREGNRHEITDLNVSVTLAGDLAATHLTGDNANVLPTDTQRNTVFAFAKRYGIGEIESFALRLARHFVGEQAAIHRARVHIEQYGWDRVAAASEHSFVRSGQEVRTATVSYDGERASVVSGLTDLMVLNSTGSEFWGFQRDDYTTLPETRDRILATMVNARWRHASADGDFGKSYREARRHLIEAFAETHSLSLQHTLYAMGARVLENRPEICEVRLSLPNRHHVAVDLSPFGLANENEVFYAADRPYGLIEGTVARDDAPDAGLAWW